MTSWIRIEHAGEARFGALIDNQIIELYEGDLFGKHAPTGERVNLGDATVLTPCDPQKLLGLWNNFHATMEKTGLPRPEHPWYFVMTPNSYAPGGSVIRRPASCSGKILFEGELGVVIGKRCSAVSIEAAADYVFGYTCVNDVTALEHLFAEDKFAHWTRAKSFDGFGVFGPVIKTGIAPDQLSIKTILENGDEIQERQNYPVSDMIYSPLEAVSHISHDMTLLPGDIIACGTSVGAGAMKDGWTVRVSIDGVGELVNTYAEAS